MKIKIKRDKVFKIGNKQYLIEDIEKVFDVRIKAIPEEDLE